jgi:hypothetical protein
LPFQNIASLAYCSKWTFTPRKHCVCRPHLLVPNRCVRVNSTDHWQRCHIAPIGIIKPLISHWFVESGFVPFINTRQKVRCLRVAKPIGRIEANISRFPQLKITLTIKLISWRCPLAGIQPIAKLCRLKPTNSGILTRLARLSTPRARSVSACAR